MRISDWSSDVCSSDLTAEQRQNLFPPQSGARGVLLHQLVRALVPFIARIVGAEHRRRLLRLGRDAEREIAFGQAVERLGGVAGRLIFVDDLAKADRRGEPVRAALIETADFHFLARWMLLHPIGRASWRERGCQYVEI